MHKAPTYEVFGRGYGKHPYPQLIGEADSQIWFRIQKKNWQDYMSTNQPCLDIMLWYWPLQRTDVPIIFISIFLFFYLERLPN